MASRRRNKRQTKSIYDVAAQVTIPDNDSQAARTKNHDVPLPPKKSCKSPPPSNAISTVITQPNFPDEASETAARTNKTATRTNAEVGVLAVPEDDSQAAGTRNYDLPPPPKKSRNSQTPSKGAPEYISQENDLSARKQKNIHLVDTKSCRNIGGSGNKLYLSSVFKHLKGSNFKYHTLLEFETWDSFNDSKDESGIFKKSHTGSYAAGWVVFTSKRVDSLYCGLRLPWLVGYKTKDTVPPRDNVNGKSENTGDLKPAAKITTSNEPESLVVKDIELAPKDWRHTQAKSQNGSNNKSEQNVQSFNCSLGVAMPKFPLIVGWGFPLHDIEVMLKDPDPEILYSIYKIGQAVMCIGRKAQIRMARRKNKGNFLGGEYSNSSSDSNSASVNEKGLEYDLDNDSDTEV
eukprot:jgi/Psemu1/1129/gm1.1129_g